MSRRHPPDRPVLALCLAAPLLLAACASQPAPPAATVPSTPREMLRGADCLDPGKARDWQAVDSHHLLVDAGRRRYRLTVSGACLFGSDVTLRFAGSQVDGRVCGNAGDRVLTRDGSCRIDDMQLLSDEAWRQAQESLHADDRTPPPR